MVTVVKFQSSERSSLARRLKTGPVLHIFWGWVASLSINTFVLRVKNTTQLRSCYISVPEIANSRPTRSTAVATMSISGTEMPRSKCQFKGIKYQKNHVAHCPNVVRCQKSQFFLTQNEVMPFVKGKTASKWWLQRVKWGQHRVTMLQKCLKSPKW